MSVIRNYLFKFRSAIHFLTSNRFERESQKSARDIQRFRNLHKGQDCFVIGNGPSLKNIDFNLLEKYYTFATNKIYLLFDQYAWRPTYYVSIDPDVIKQSLHLYNDFTFPKFISLHGLRRNTTDSFQNTYLFSTGYRFEFKGSQNSFSNIGEGHTVTYVALQLAYYMGFKNVFLIGVDHRYNTIGKPDEKKVLETPDDNHFHPDYFRNQVFPQPNLKASEISYQIAKLYFEEDGRKIFDATYNGNLNIFDKIDFLTALSMCKKISS